MHRRTQLLASATLTAALTAAGLTATSAVGSTSPGGFTSRGDIRHLPQALKGRLATLAGRPRTFVPMTAFSEAPRPSQLFQYYLLDTHGFQRNVFTTTIKGINDGVAPSATGPNHDLPTIGAVRVVLEPKPGLPTDPEDPGAFIDIFTDLSGLFVINNESGWYEGWMIHDVTVPEVASARADGHARFGTITTQDAAKLARMGSGNNVPRQVFTLDGNAVRLPRASDRFPDRVSNTVPLQLSMGAYNATQQSDLHAYWEFNEYTNWAPPTYELPFTGGIPGTFKAGRIGARQSIVPGSGPSGIINRPQRYGDNPYIPRDPDRAVDTSLDSPDRPMVNNPAHKETRLRFIPTGLANEVLLDAYVRLASFEPAVHSLQQRIFDGYAAEVARVDANHDGVITFVEGDPEGQSDGQPNDRLFLSPTAFGRFAVTREINDGLLSPRFAPSQRAWVQTGSVVKLAHSVEASVPQDGDNR